MRMKHAAVVAGLALEFMSGAANATSLEYNVLLFLPNIPETVTGTIDTDDKAGALNKSDILAFDLNVGGTEISSSSGGGVFQEGGNNLYAVGNQLNFNFDGTSGDQLEFASRDGILNLFSGDTLAGPYIQTYQGVNNLMPGVLTIGVSEGTVMSPVPLPTSAPMFGAALLALGAVGYGLKRKGKTAA